MTETRAMMTEKTKTIYSKDREEWRSWLQENHQSEAGVWLIYYKRHTGKPSITYDEAVEEAICFGWIDGQIKKIDDERYMQRYTPRKSKSLWSVINIERARKMIEQGRMTESGLKTYRDGIKNKQRVPSSKSFVVPADLDAALVRNKKAWKHFQEFTPSAKLAYVYWVTTAKTDDTRRKRISETVEQSARNKKFGEK